MTLLDRFNNPITFSKKQLFKDIVRAFLFGKRIRFDLVVCEYCGRVFRKEKVSRERCMKWGGEKHHSVYMCEECYYDPMTIDCDTRKQVSLDPRPAVKHWIKQNAMSNNVPFARGSEGEV